MSRCGPVSLPLCLVCLVLAASPGRADPDPPADPEGPEDAKLLAGSGVKADGPALLEFVRKRIPSEEKRVRIRALIRQFSDDDFDVRDRASKAIVALGPVARPQLAQALRDLDSEVSHRAENALQMLPREDSRSPLGAVVRQLGRTNPPGTVEALLDFLPEAEDQDVVEAIGKVLGKVGLEAGKPHPLILKAATDRQVRLRLVAGEVLCRAAKEHRGEAHKLLRDPEILVRAGVALHLLAIRDRESIPALIDLLADAPSEQRYQIEDRLRLLAGEKAPGPLEADTDLGRREYRAAWRRWWRESGPGLDLAKIDLSPRFFNYALVCSLEARLVGRVQEFDPAGKLRLEIAVRYPVSAVVVGPDRVVISEYRGSTVSERKFNGEIVWQKAVSLPLGASRLPNGNTVLFSRNRIEEVDRTGKEVRAIPRPGDLLAGQVDAAGNIHVLTSSGAYQKLDRDGKLLKTFNVGAVTIYTSFQLLPGGRILVPLYSQSKVVEFDENGKAFWEVVTVRPNCAQRLPNGHTLVASRTNRRISELDQRGKEVWGRNFENTVFFAQKR